MRLRTDGLAELQLDMLSLWAMPDSVLIRMVEAEAEVVARVQREQAIAMGVWDTGATAESIGITSGKRNSSGVYATVYPKGSTKKGKKRYTLSERAFLNEFGKKNQPARPFIRTANEMAADEALDAACDIYEKFLESL